jgi:hypothetical protein
MKRMTAMPALLIAASQTTESIRELQEQIRCRAYELYEERGRQDGHGMDDWLQAEAEVTQRKAKTATA